MRVGQIRKRDASEREIKRALEAIGIVVERLNDAGVADLLCWQPSAGETGLRLLEVKTKAGHLTAAQRRSRLPRIVVRSVDEALSVFGLRAGH